MLIPEWAREAVPQPVKTLVRTVPLLMSALQMARATRETNSPAEAWAVLSSSQHFSAQQKKTEIVAALEGFVLDRPRHILEIGAAGGGTSFLLSRVAGAESLVVSVDLNLRTPLKIAMGAWARRDQRIVGLRGDSHSYETAREIASLVETDLDLLFIDGDHSYDGVKRDFEMYSPMVRKGGVIAFHDIVPDNASRGRPKSLAWSGGVPRFWSEVRGVFGGREYVEDREQDGYGIGVIRWPEPRGLVSAR